MRSTMLAPTLLMISSLALPAGELSIDLDRPGSLDRLKLEHPQRYQAVSGVLRAAKRMPCEGDEMKLLKSRFGVRDMECGMILLTRYPALRHVSFELDGTNYAATVQLEDTDTLQLIRSSTELPASH